MRVCFVTSVAMPPEEGIGYYVWNLAQQLIRKGHWAHIITRGKPGAKRCERLGEITVWRPMFLPLYPFHVHFHSRFVNRLVAHLQREIDIFHVHSPLPPAINTYRPVLLTVHTPMRAKSRALPLTDFYSLRVKLQLPASYGIECRLLRSSARVTTVAQSVVNDLQEYGVQQLDVTVLLNGVDPDLFVPNGALTGGPLRVFAAGRLERRKGFQDLVECARKVCDERPDVQFQIAGKGPMERALQAMIDRAGLGQQVTLLGYVADRARLIELYQQATIFVQPSHYEGLPTVLLEAMSCGRPVVATAVSGIPDVITSGQNGILVSPRDPVQLAETISHLLGDASLRARLGQAARQTIEMSYSWEAVSANYIQEYEQLLNGDT